MGLCMYCGKRLHDTFAGSEADGPMCKCVKINYQDKYNDLKRRVKETRTLVRPVNHAVGMDHVAILDFDRLLPEGKEE